MSMKIQVNDKMVDTNEQGFLCNLDDWSEDFAEEIARRDGIELFVDHWELIDYFRDYHDVNQKNPTMHSMVGTLGKSKGSHFHEQKDYEKHIYNLFPKDPIHEICKLAGLPMPPPDT
jgi:tRNA 2-thiouridine synthesizing protein E